MGSWRKRRQLGDLGPVLGKQGQGGEGEAVGVSGVRGGVGEGVGEVARDAGADRKRHSPCG